MTGDWEAIKEVITIEESVLKNPTTRALLVLLLTDKNNNFPDFEIQWLWPSGEETCQWTKNSLKEVLKYIKPKSDFPLDAYKAINIPSWTKQYPQLLVGKNENDKNDTENKDFLEAILIRYLQKFLEWNINPNKYSIEKNLFQKKEKSFMNYNKL